MARLTFGQSLAGAGDVDGDGFGDLLVGAPESSLMGFAYLFRGSTAFLPTIPSDVFAPTSPPEYSEFAYSAGAAGDINGDGFGDFVFGSNGQDAVYLYLGTGSGTVTPILLDGSMYSGPGDPSAFGWSVAGAGDLDGDGYADLVVGAANYGSGAGAAFLYFGGPGGVASLPDVQLTVPRGAFEPFGWSVQGVGDLNGDHLSDLAIGSEGSVALYYGRADRNIRNPDRALISVDPGVDFPVPGFGTALGAPGDLNGDGYADLIVGAFGDGPDGAGRVFVYWGGASGIDLSPQEIRGDTTNRFGSSVGCAGDVDGDGYEDLVVGTDPLHGGGYLSFFPGGSMGVSTTPRDSGPYSSGFGIQVAIGVPRDAVPDRSWSIYDPLRVGYAIPPIMLRCAIQDYFHNNNLLSSNKTARTVRVHDEPQERTEGGSG